MSLYRKYRPLDFASLQGQDHIREILQSALHQQRVSHAYLFTGPRGTGKTSTARILARAINCLDLRETGPCNTCMMCVAALQESLTDLVEIDAASHGLVDDARALVEQSRFMPTQARKKIYIIDEVHMLSKSAFNALLKVIEEPPEHVHFILATTESHKVLDTIKSRCQRFDFHLADEEELFRNLQHVCHAEKISFEDEALRLVAQHARGSFRDSLSLLEQVIGAGSVTVETVQEAFGLSESSAVDSFVQALTQYDKSECLRIIQQVHEQGIDLSQFCQAILDRLRAKLLQDQQEGVLPWIDVFFQALDQLRDAVIVQLPLELAVFKCLSGSSPSVSSPQVVVEQSPATKKPRKITPSIAEASKTPEPTEPSIPPKAVSTGAFDPSAFISSMKSAPLRVLLKHVQFEVSGQEVKILARSQFELSKLRESAFQMQIADGLKTYFGSGVSLHLGLSEEKPSQEGLPSSKGMSNNDVFSVFS